MILSFVIKMNLLLLLLILILHHFVICNSNHNNVYSNSIKHSNAFINTTTNIKYSKSLLNLYGGDNNNNGMGYRLVQDAAIGKDREIFHLAIDLKWLWCTIIDGSTWLNLLSKIGNKIKSLTTSKDNEKRESRFREIVSDILIGIKVFNRASSLKLFLGDLKQMEKISTMNAKFVVVYVEGGDSKVPSRESIEYRKALSDISLGNMLNDQFIFSATSTQIPAMQKLVKKLNSGKECPFFAVLCPSSIVNDEGIDSISGKQVEDLELLATLRLPINEIKPNKISRFLVRTLEVFDAKLSSLKFYSEEIQESAKKRLINETKVIENSEEKTENFKLNEKLLKLPPEPSITERNTITITIRPRQGDKLHHIRRFRLSDTFQAVDIWAEACGELHTEDLIISDPSYEVSLKLKDIMVCFIIYSDQYNNSDKSYNRIRHY